MASKRKKRSDYLPRNLIRNINRRIRNVNSAKAKRASLRLGVSSEEFDERVSTINSMFEAMAMDLERQGLMQANRWGQVFSYAKNDDGSLYVQIRESGFPNQSTQPDDYADLISFLKGYSGHIGFYGKPTYDAFGNKTTPRVSTVAANIPVRPDEVAILIKKMKDQKLDRQAKTYGRGGNEGKFKRPRGSIKRYKFVANHVFNLAVWNKIRQNIEYEGGELDEFINSVGYDLQMNEEKDLGLNLDDPIESGLYVILDYVMNNKPAKGKLRWNATLENMFSSLARDIRDMRKKAEI